MEFLETPRYGGTPVPRFVSYAAPRGPVEWCLVEMSGAGGARVSRKYKKVKEGRDESGTLNSQARSDLCMQPLTAHTLILIVIPAPASKIFSLPDAPAAGRPWAAAEAAAAQA